MPNEDVKRQENNEIIDHLNAVREIIERECNRCEGGMSGCMGCIFDAFARGMIPASLDQILHLMSNMANDRRGIVAEGSNRYHERETKWLSIVKENGNGY